MVPCNKLRNLNNILLSVSRTVKWKGGGGRKCVIIKKNCNAKRRKKITKRVCEMLRICWFISLNFHFQMPEFRKSFYHFCFCLFSLFSKKSTTWFCAFRIHVFLRYLILFLVLLFRYLCTKC